MLRTNKPTNKARAPRILHRKWLEHIERCTDSGQSAAHYCAAHHLSLHSFRTHDWRRRKASETTTTNFLPVKIVHEPRVALSHYEIGFPKGIILRVPNTGTLSSLLKTLEVYL